MASYDWDGKKALTWELKVAWEISNDIMIRLKIISHVCRVQSEFS